MTRTALLDMTPETLDTATGEAQVLLAGAKAKLGVPAQYVWLHGKAAARAGGVSVDL